VEGSGYAHFEGTMKNDYDISVAYPTSVSKTVILTKHFHLPDDKSVKATVFWDVNQLPADALGTLSCKPSNFRKRVRKVINKAK
jgi:hypothetical protein